MTTKAERNDILSDYKVANPEERLEIMFENYHIFPKVIRKMEKRTQYKIKAEKEYQRSQAREELGVRVQTSTLSNPTEAEVVAKITLEEAFATGVIDPSILRGIDNAAEYEADIRIISVMRDDYELVTECVEDLEDEDSKLLKAALVQRKFFKELACEFNLSYDTVKRRISFLKDLIKDDVIDCIEMNCR